MDYVTPKQRLTAGLFNQLIDAAGGPDVPTDGYTKTPQGSVQRKRAAKTVGDPKQYEVFEDIAFKSVTVSADGESSVETRLFMNFGESVQKIRELAGADLVLIDRDLVAEGEKRLVVMEESCLWTYGEGRTYDGWVDLSCDVWPGDDFTLARWTGEISLSDGVSSFVAWSTSDESHLSASAVEYFQDMSADVSIEQSACVATTVSGGLTWPGSDLSAGPRVIKYCGIQAPQKASATPGPWEVRVVDGKCVFDNCAYVFGRRLLFEDTISASVGTTEDTTWVYAVVSHPTAQLSDATLGVAFHNEPRDWCTDLSSEYLLYKMAGSKVIVDFRQTPTTGAYE